MSKVINVVWFDLNTEKKLRAELRRQISTLSEIDPEETSQKRKCSTIDEDKAAELRRWDRST